MLRWVGWQWGGSARSCRVAEVDRHTSFWASDYLGPPSQQGYHRRERRKVMAGKNGYCNRQGRKKRSNADIIKGHVGKGGTRERWACMHVSWIDGYDWSSDARSSRGPVDARNSRIDEHLTIIAH